MKIRDIVLSEDGRITPYNTTKDVKPGEIKRQAAKFGNNVSDEGVPPQLSSKVKGGQANTAFNLGLTESLADVKTPTARELAKHHNVSINKIIAQLRKGTKVEREHTHDPQMAREIALDHLKELPDYYDRLETVEKGIQLPKK